MKKILLPTDFSIKDQKAIDYAISLFENQSCTFYFLNVFQANKKTTDIAAMVPEPEDQEYEMAKKTSEAGLATLLDSLKANSKHSYQKVSSYNSLLFALKDTIKKKEIELLVIATPGASDSADSEHEKALDIMEYITNCHVLAVPEDYTFTGLKRILFPTDYEIRYDMGQLSFMFELAKTNHTDVTLLLNKEENDVDEAQQENKLLLESMLTNLLHSEYTTEHMKTTKAIDLYTEEQKCDLLVFVDKKSDYVGNSLSKPLIKFLEGHLPAPVLALNVIPQVQKNEKKIAKLI